MKRTRASTRSAVFTVALLACAAAQAQEVNDPFEPVNRVIYQFNEAVDRAVLKPVAEGYQAVVPALVRRGVSNVFANIGDLFSAVNNTLQGKIDRAGADFGRVMVNSTFGLGGIFDIIGETGAERNDEDFGQTFGWWGIGPGPYLVLPFLGPSSARDAVGTLITLSLDPVNRVSDPERYGVGILRTVDVRTGLLGTEKLVEQAALDKYTFVRGAYLQRRRNQVYDGKPPPEE